jgi:hypothetical protein
MRVRATRHLSWAGKLYLPGDVFEVSNVEARELLNDELVEPVPDEEQCEGEA